MFSWLFGGHIFFGKTKKYSFPNKCADDLDPSHPTPSLNGWQVNCNAPVCHQIRTPGYQWHQVHGSKLNYLCNHMDMVVLIKAHSVFFESESLTRRKRIKKSVRSDGFRNLVVFYKIDVFQSWWVLYLFQLYMISFNVLSIYIYCTKFLSVLSIRLFCLP